MYWLFKWHTFYSCFNIHVINPKNHVEHGCVTLIRAPTPTSSTKQQRIHDKYRRQSLQYLEIDFGEVLCLNLSYKKIHTKTL